MTTQELCNDVIRSIHEGIPGDHGEVIRYLQQQYISLQQHPCFLMVVGEFGKILTTRCQVDEFFWFCEEIDTPEPLIRTVLNDCTDFIGLRDYKAAASLIRYILPFGEGPWPESGVGTEVRSFRDLVEYTYYMVICEPEREVIIEPYLKTDILLQYGRILSGMGENELALPVLEDAKRQSPVHAGILGSLADIQLKMNQPDQAGDIILRSFRCSWMKKDLAHAYRNQGSLFSLHEKYDAAITCYLIAEAWDDSPDGGEALRSIIEYSGKEYDPGYYNEHGREILIAYGIPVGPDPEVTSLLVKIADDYLEEQNLFKAREYLIRAHQLLMSDQLEERIWRIERFIEDQVDF
ncbi:MAG: hypothetical protein CVV33_01690 [Methanomicrobiales archaeon HGW-Methanomicrobiales-4]|nr:MAG: hypothetical protein CVV33_01690 [Methanomicrobiales archaeon HGW-Methanomicrobiales-4]